MPVRILITAGTLSLRAELNDSQTAEKLASLLPLEFTMHRWGDEYYGDCGITSTLSKEARDVLEIGELAVWPTGKALCIFFGPTAASRGKEPRAVSPVNPVGKLIDSPEPLKQLADSIHVRIDLSA